MRVLIIGNLSNHLTKAAQIVKAKGAKVVHTSDIDSAMEMLRSGQGADLLMVEVTQNIEFLAECLNRERISVEIISCGIDSDKVAAVNSIKAGAKEFIPLPPDEELIAAVIEALAAEQKEVIHASEEMKQVLKICEQVANSNANILITGESGVGKEVIANYLHSKSNRKDKNLISLNCAAIPENLLESELFGHEKGAFTGAVAQRIGKFEESNGGTLLLDEISEMDIKLQAKLLRAIQEGVIDRVGGTKPVKVDLRIIATSNRDLPKEVKAGKFREDLYFRLNVVNIEIPPLKDRKTDIKPVAEFFVQKYCQSNGIEAKKLNDDAVKKLESYDWPGNIRELENIIHRAVLFSPDNVISSDTINISIEGTDKESSLEEAEETACVDYDVKSMIGKTVADVEKDLIINTLDHCLGNRTHAANILGISIRTLRNKLKQYGKTE